MTRANPKKGRLSPIDIIFSMVIGLGVVFLLVALLASGAEAHNDNVKTGEVKVTTGLYKICDGKNLVYTYTSHGVAVSPNDPQCN